MKGAFYMENQKIEVETPLGVLCAEVGGDTQDYPEIFVYIRRPDGVEIDLTCASVCVETPGHIDVFNYRDTATECWTDKFTVSKDQINIKIE